MRDEDESQVCRNCSHSGLGAYCSRCGQPYEQKRITLHGLLHDVFHLFTHLDKGFGYTLKLLILAPGHMQRTYIEGERSRHQKPFSMFFICATLAALTRYWIFEAMLKFYQAGNASEAKFFHEYMVMLHIILLPLYILITYLLFRKSGYNYAEIGVLMLYMTSFFFIVSIAISLLKFIWPHLDTAYIELPVLLLYNAITFLNFFHRSPRWWVVVKSTAIIITVFMLIQVVEDFVVRNIS
jgi:hypothetical protein